LAAERRQLPLRACPPTGPPEVAISQEAYARLLVHLCQSLPRKGGVILACNLHMRQQQQQETPHLAKHPQQAEHGPGVTNDLAYLLAYLVSCCHVVRSAPRPTLPGRRQRPFMAPPRGLPLGNDPSPNRGMRFNRQQQQIRPTPSHSKGFQVHKGDQWGETAKPVKHLALR